MSTASRESFHGASESWKAAGSDNYQVGFNDTFDASVLTVVSSDVESLRKGIIKTSKNDAQAQYTILLVGETGTGKSTFLEFVDNVLTGKGFNRYEFQTLDKNNEQGGSGGQSQTNSPRIYELSSNNGIFVSNEIREYYKHA